MRNSRDKTRAIDFNNKVCLNSDLSLHRSILAIPQKVNLIYLYFIVRILQKPTIKKIGNLKLKYKVNPLN